MPEVLCRLGSHSGEIRFDIVYVSASFADEVHVIGADIFIYGALLSDGQPAYQTHLRQVVERAVDRRRPDAIQTFQNLVGGQVAALFRKDAENHFRLCADSRFHRLLTPFLRICIIIIHDIRAIVKGFENIFLRIILIYFVLQKMRIAASAITHTTINTSSTGSGMLIRS